MGPVSKALARLRAAIDGRNLRERVLLLAAVVVVLVLIWDVAVRAPIAARGEAAEERRDRLAEESEELDSNRAELRDQIDEVAADDSGDRRARLEEALAEVDEEIGERTARVVSPQQMVRVLRDMVTAEDDLTLERLVNEGVEEIIVEDGDEDDESVPRVFRHRVEVVASGDFFTILGYLENLEDLDWRFQWDALELETEDYPRARVRLRLSTLSLDEGWLGV